MLAVCSSAVLAGPNGKAVLKSSSAPQRQLQPIVGDNRPVLALTDLLGSRHDIVQSTGKAVLVHFFATWCEPCREELTSLSEFVAQNEGGELTVLAVNVAEPPARVKRFFEKTPVNYPVLLDTDRAVTRSWGVSVLPTTFVLDQNGIARLHVEGDINWLREDVLARLAEMKTIGPK